MCSRNLCRVSIFLVHIGIDIKKGYEDEPRNPLNLIIIIELILQLYFDRIVN